MERGPRIITKVSETVIIEVGQVGEFGVRVKRHKTVPEGIDPDDESLGRWRIVSVTPYILSRRDQPLEPPRKKPRV